MKLVKKFALPGIVFEVLSYGGLKEFLPAYFDCQSSKGLHLLKAGIFLHTFSEDSAKRYKYIAVGLQDLDFSYYNHDKEWDFVCKLGDICFFKKTLVDETEFINKTFSAAEYEEEAGWLNENVRNGLMLINIDAGYEFEKTNEPQYIEHLVECRHDISDFNEYIKLYQEQGWQFICKSDDRFYFYRSDVFQDGMQKTSLDKNKLADMKIHSQKRNIIIAAVLIATIAIPLVFALRITPEAGTDDPRLILGIAGAVWITVFVGVIIASIRKMKKEKDKASRFRKLQPEKTNSSISTDDRAKKVWNLKKEINKNIGVCVLGLLFEGLFVFYIIEWLVLKENPGLFIKIISIPFAVFFPVVVVSVIKEIVKTHKKIGELQGSDEN